MSLFGAGAVLATLKTKFLRLSKKKIFSAQQESKKSKG
jgi:hypothetical protein